MTWEADFFNEKLDRILAELKRLDADVRRLSDDLALLRDAVAAPLQTTLPFPSFDLAAQLVTLDQAAAMVHRSKSCLESYRHKGLPEPHVKGRKGQPGLYLWMAMRPWLMAAFGVQVPEEFPSFAG